MQVKDQEKLRETLIKLLSERNVIQRGKFVLSSGRESDYYVDIKRAITDPEVLDVIARLIKGEVEGADKIAGPALGAVPIATAVSLYSRKPLLMIRKEKKGYGTSKLIEGELNTGERVAVVEDVTTTGGSLLRAVGRSRKMEEWLRKHLLWLTVRRGRLMNSKKGVLNSYR